MAQKTKSATTNRRKRRKSRKKKDPVSFFTFVGRIIRDQRFKNTLGIGFIFFAGLMAVAFISYLFTWKADQSILQLSWAEIHNNPNVSVQNWAGKTGASIANRFVHDWFGIASFAFVVLFIVAGFRLLKVKLMPVGKTLYYSILIVIWTSVALSFTFNEPYFLGGAHGHYLNQWLNTLFGKFGTALLLIVTFFAFIYVHSRNSFLVLQKLIKKISLPNLQISNISMPHIPSVKMDKNNDNADTFFDDEEEQQEGPTTERETYLLTDEGEEVENAEKTNEPNGTKDTADDLGFETVNTLENKENTATAQDRQNQDGMALSVEKGRDLQRDILDQQGEYDPARELSNYKFPGLDILEDHRSGDVQVTKEELIRNKNRIVETLKNYKIEIKKIKATIGPTITLYEIVPAPGVRISKIKNLEDDIALSLAALGIRIIAPMPGRGTVGIEVPNENPETVSIRSVLSSAKYQEGKHELPLAIGKTISNESFVVDLTKMPHLLIAGATGQGKSVGINAVIASLLYKKHPSQLKFVLVDPKKVELNIFEKIERHYLAKLPDAEEAIITENQTVVHTLSSLNNEMDKRYELLKNAQTRNIKEYNQKFTTRRLNPEKGHRYLPYIVLIIDEFADLIMTAGKEIEMPIARLAQLARAVGIHLIVATQRPSTNIITGVIKANFPTRIAFKVASMVDSRTILDSPGANQLIGRGDMLIAQSSDMTRLQCAFIDTPEIEKIVNYIGDQAGFATAYVLPEYESDQDGGGDILDDKDALFEEAARLVVTHQQGSTSLIQRKMSIGYNRAGRIVDQLEAAGIVGPSEGSKARKVMYSDEYALQQYLDTI